MRKFLLTLLILTKASHAGAWSFHYLITREYLKAHYPQLFNIYLKTETVNPLYKHYDPSSPEIYIGFPCDEIYKGIDRKKVCPDYKIAITPGIKLSVGEILSVFSDEPDWGLDEFEEENLTASLMGGAQALYHLYIPFPFLKVPLLIFPQGRAPWRAQYFFNLAKEDLAHCNLYRGTRYLARALHYAEDIAQPLHTFQTWWRFIDPASPIKGTERITRNFHSAFEHLMLFQIVREVSQLEPPVLTLALSKAEPGEYRNVHSMMRIKARESRKLLKRLLKVMWNSLSSKLAHPREALISYPEGIEILSSAQGNQLKSIAAEALDNLDLTYMIEQSGLTRALEACPLR